MEARNSDENKELMKPQINTDFKTLFFLIYCYFSSLSCVNLVKSCGWFYNFLCMNKFWKQLIVTGLASRNINVKGCPDTYLRINSYKPFMLLYNRITD